MLGGTRLPEISRSLMMQISSVRLLKMADNKASGSAATATYPCGTSQGDGRPRTQ